jgi:thiol-disulfide isomerase/thioredoxin
MSLLSRRPAVFLMGLSLLGGFSSASAGRAPGGMWKATVVAGDLEVPFRFEVAVDGDQARGVFWNGDEAVHSTGGTFSGDTLALSFDQYGGALEAHYTEGRLSGEYVRAGKAPLPFRAAPNAPSLPFPGPVPAIAGTWDIPVTGARKEQAWRFFVRQAGAQVTASILRVDGDTGTLFGRWDEDRFVLGHFSGGRPMRLEISPTPDGSLALVLDGKPLRALSSAQARAQNLPAPADPAHWTTVQDPAQPLRFSGVDLEGKTVSEADFRGNVVLVNIMGSWCPNCHDEAPFLAELDRKYRKRGLRVVSIAFEDAGQLANPTRLRAFLKAYGIEYTVLLGGEPGEVSKRLPQAVNLTTWPATFFVGRDGLVHEVHAGFAGPATGDEHQRLIGELTRSVEKLLAQRARGGARARPARRS